MTFATTVEQAELLLRSTAGLDHETEARLQRAAHEVAPMVSREFLVSAWKHKVVSARPDDETERRRLHHYRIALAMTILDKLSRGEAAPTSPAEPRQWAILLPREQPSTDDATTAPAARGDV